MKNKLEKARNEEGVEITKDGGQGRAGKERNESITKASSFSS